MKALIPALIATVVLSTSSMASPAKHRVPHHPSATDFYAVSPTPSHVPARAPSCIGLSSGTADASCNATLTGGPSGGIN